MPRTANLQTQISITVHSFGYAPNRQTRRLGHRPVRGGGRCAGSGCDPGSPPSEAGGVRAENGPPFKTAAPGGV